MNNSIENLGIQFTCFMDMFSHGVPKSDYQYIVIPLPEDEAIKYMKDELNLDVDNVSCDCCGKDFTYYENFIPSSCDESNTLYVSL